MQLTSKHFCILVRLHETKLGYNSFDINNIHGCSMRLFTKALSIWTILFLSGCAPITITQTGGSDFQARPHYEESKYFFFWGLIGEHHINVKEICQNQPVKQMQTKYSASDVLWGTLTAGLYLPRTAIVWCEVESK